MKKLVVVFFLAGFAASASDSIIYGSSGMEFSEQNRKNILLKRMPSENAKDPYEEKAIANARNENISSEDIQKALETRKNWIADELELKNRDFRILKYGGVDFLLDL